jgi:transposase-like protein
MSEAQSEEQRLFERAVVRAGSVDKLARAIGYEQSSLYKARRAGQFSLGVVAALREYVGVPPEPHLPAGDEEQPEATEATEATEAPPAPVAEPPREAAPPAPRDEAQPHQADEVVVRFPRRNAEVLYRELRRNPVATAHALALSIADALLGAA